MISTIISIETMWYKPSHLLYLMLDAEEKGGYSKGAKGTEMRMCSIYVLDDLNSPYAIVSYRATVWTYAGDKPNRTYPTGAQGRNQASCVLFTFK